MRQKGEILGERRIWMARRKEMDREKERVTKKKLGCF
jgi:hypothetical protein